MTNNIYFDFDDTPNDVRESILTLNDEAELFQSLNVLMTNDNDASLLLAKSSVPSHLDDAKALVLKSDQSRTSHDSFSPLYANTSDLINIRPKKQNLFSLCEFSDINDITEYIFDEKLESSDSEYFRSSASYASTKLGTLKSSLASEVKDDLVENNCTTTINSSILDSVNGIAELSGIPEIDSVFDDKHQRHTMISKMSDLETSSVKFITKDNTQERYEARDDSVHVQEFVNDLTTSFPDNSLEDTAKPQVYGHCSTGIDHPIPLKGSVVDLKLFSHNGGVFGSEGTNSSDEYTPITPSSSISTSSPSSLDIDPSVLVMKHQPDRSFANPRIRTFEMVNESITNNQQDDHHYNKCNSCKRQYHPSKQSTDFESDIMGGKSLNDLQRRQLQGLPDELTPELDSLLDSMSKNAYPWQKIIPGTIPCLEELNNGPFWQYEHVKKQLINPDIPVHIRIEEASRNYTSSYLVTLNTNYDLSTKLPGKKKEREETINNLNWFLGIISKGHPGKLEVELTVLRHLVQKPQKRGNAKNTRRSLNRYMVFLTSARYAFKYYHGDEPDLIERDLARYASLLWSSQEEETQEAFKLLADLDSRLHGIADRDYVYRPQRD
ncbi:hypothetical protein V1511DRAFT_501858 [Dipodascopsis uninucleata]